MRLDHIISRQSVEIALWRQRLAITRALIARDVLSTRPENCEGANLNRIRPGARHETREVSGIERLTVDANFQPQTCRSGPCETSRPGAAVGSASDKPI